MPVFSIGDSTANFLPEKLYLDGCIWYNVRRKRMVSARIASVGPYARSGIDSVCLRWMEILPANRECLRNEVPEWKSKNAEDERRNGFKPPRKF